MHRLNLDLHHISRRAGVRVIGLGCVCGVREGYPAWGVLTIRVVLTSLLRSGWVFDRPNGVQTRWSIGSLLSLPLGTCQPHRAPCGV